MTKQVSRGEFVGAHVGVIVFHILLAAVVLFATWKNYPIALYVSGGVLMLVSFMGLAPILMKNEYHIEA